MKVALDECSAKVSEGFPEEPDDDLALDVWAGILPLRVVPGEPQDDPLLRPDTPRPTYVTRLASPRPMTEIRLATRGGAPGRWRGPVRRGVHRRHDVAMAASRQTRRSRT